MEKQSSSTEERRSHPCGGELRLVITGKERLRKRLALCPSMFLRPCRRIKTNFRTHLPH